MKSKVQDFPAFLDISARKVVVVGGGNNAARKAVKLVASGADVHVIATQLDARLEELLKQRCVVQHARAWSDSDFTGVSLVVAASDDRLADRKICKAAEAAGAWVNVANQPSISSFIIPSVVDRSPLLIAISSGGSSPILARLLTARINAFLPQTYSELGELAKRYSETIRLHIKDWRHRRAFWERMLSGRVGELILQGQPRLADAAIEQAIAEYDDDKPAEGEVFLVGAGPGDPDLLSFRALRLMQQCEVVLHDRLVSEPILELVNRDAHRVYVGKQRSDHAVPQEQINAQLVSYARAGKRVLRLKGGDPFIFGRGGEEIETLAAEGISFQVVPGITAAAGCASYAGIPLTHRDHAQVCMFVTGHLKDGSINLDWPALARAHQTVVIYMGLAGLSVICQQLVKHGLPATHPIALVAQGTRSNQQVLTGTLASLPELVEAEDINPPTLIIVGSVVQLRKKLAWFETRQ